MPGPTRSLTPEQEQEIVSLHNQGLTNQGIADRISTSKANVDRTLRRCGVERTKPRVSPWDKRRAIEACLNGYTLDQAVAKFGVSKSTLVRTLREQQLSLPAGRPPVHTLNHYAFDEITPESAYWIGFLFADGAVLHDNVGAPAVTVNLAERDRAHLEKFRTFLGSTHAIGVGTSSLGGPTATFRVRSRQLADKLASYGMVRPKSERAPAQALTESRDFWRGAVDGDGTVGAYNYRQYRYAMVNLCGQRALLERFQFFLIRNGIAWLEMKPTQSGIFRIQTNGRTAEAAIKLLYEGAGEALARKRDRARLILSGNLDQVVSYKESRDETSDF